MANKDKVNEQIRYFYEQRPGITHADNVRYELVTDVFSRRLSLVQSSQDESLTLRQKDFLQQVNGNVVWGKTATDPITVLIAEKVFQLDDHTWRGTVHHEYTHAHDFWDLTDYLGIAEMADIYDYQFYYPFYLWSEYHARKNGSSNVYRQTYANYTALDITNVCNITFEDIRNKLICSTSPYDVMQAFGRYSSLKGLYGAKMPSFQFGQRKYGLSQRIINVGCFLHSHQNFALICKDLDKFERLINEM